MLGRPRRTTTIDDDDDDDDDVLYDVPLIAASHWLRLVLGPLLLFKHEKGKLSQLFQALKGFILETVFFLDFQTFLSGLFSLDM